MAKLSARGCFELLRWVCPVNGNTIVLRSDGKVLYKPGGCQHADYTILVNRSASMAASPAAWRALNPEEQSARIENLDQRFTELGYRPAEPRVTKGSHYQQEGQGHYWRALRRRYNA